MPPIALSRRHLLRGVALGAAGLAAGAPSAAARKPRLVGSGRVGGPVPGKTIPSPSDFGFTADAEGGHFVCSMFGTATGGFKGCAIMTVEGVVTPNSLQIHKGTATFAGTVSIFVYPDVFFQSSENIILTAPAPFQVTAVLGGAGKASMILHIPSVTEVLGGDTGGMLAFGRIDRDRFRN